LFRTKEGAELYQKEIELRQDPMLEADWEVLEVPEINAEYPFILTVWDYNGKGSDGIFQVVEA
jgi:hypothetical protein